MFQVILRGVGKHPYFRLIRTGRASKMQNENEKNEKFKSENGYREDPSYDHDRYVIINSERPAELW
jgi:hypothetical protein